MFTYCDVVILFWWYKSLSITVEFLVIKMTNPMITIILNPSLHKAYYV